MKLPKRIWVEDKYDCWYSESQTSEESRNRMVEYIRTDIVKRILSRIPHHVDCGAYYMLPDSERALVMEDDCTCGLSELLKEIQT